jgi:hypothetical protein
MHIRGLHNSISVRINWRGLVFGISNKIYKGLLGDGLPSGSPHLFKNTRGLPEADHGGRSKLARICEIVWWHGGKKKKLFSFFQNCCVILTNSHINRNLLSYILSKKWHF